MPTVSASRIAVVGSINLDIVVSLPRLPVAGETVLGSGLVHAPGGKGANQALAAARLGARVSMVGAVGTDEYAEPALANLRRDGVDLSRVATVPGPTGVALVTVAEDGENQIVVVPGANDHVVPDPSALDADAVLCQAEISTAALAALAGVPSGLLVLNAAPAGRPPEPLARRADLIVVNTLEREALGPVPDDAVVVTTRGTDGADAHRGGTLLCHVPARPVPAVDTVGAGDTFCAALAVSLVEGCSLRSALHNAGEAAAVAVQRAGAQAAMPHRDELTDWRTS